MLHMEPLTSPTYFIIAGSEPNEGAVLTRDRNTLANLWSLNVSTAVADSWYLLETNYVSISIWLHDQGVYFDPCMGGVY